MVPIDAAGVVQEHLDRNQFRGIAIGDLKVREVPALTRGGEGPQSAAANRPADSNWRKCGSPSLAPLDLVSPPRRELTPQLTP
jgi:hypothetical protein